mmetsp:Transcript_33367/g.46576  ORF Transcript_33367/g.46576 Transcript_33367/m.46576 type:complete len:96 (+) Transcript_33367:118-405(+)
MANKQTSDDSINLILKAGYKVSEIENDLLFKAIVKVLIERHELLFRTSSSTTTAAGVRDGKYHGTMTKMWRRHRKAAVIFGKVSIKSFSLHANRR